ncbi:MAG TPA: tRNA dihydrouridine synthase DusB, partial [Candidatus Methylomirabilis sp.]|nr:tRNA dihydrouridine synthase DusB [Candidatus Methylomirabilis sp.]
MQIGPYRLSSNLIAAPMTGVTDRPFRQLCRAMGAGMAVSEMLPSDRRLYGLAKTRRRADHQGEAPPISVQIAGADPSRLAEAARYNLDTGAQIIDINMGCPARKVCKAMAGSALLRDESLVGRILDAVVRAVNVPVTLKIRTGWDEKRRNALTIARIAEAAGVQALTIHGRTRACRFSGEAEYDTIAAVKSHVRIPVIANGDIDTPEKAKAVLNATGADGVMIGRAALGRPWIFRETLHFLLTGRRFPPPDPAEIRGTVLFHLDRLYSFYGERIGVNMARKHIRWYTEDLPGSAAFLQQVFRVTTMAEQCAVVDRFLAEQEIGFTGDGCEGCAAA